MVVKKLIMKKNSVLQKNAVLNVLKQSCSILFPLITLPYFSRVLGAEYFGKINFANSIINYFVLIAGLGISSYAIREGARLRERKNKLTEFVNEIFTINLISSIFSLVLLIIVVSLSSKLKEYRELLIIYSLIIILNVIGSDWINNIFEDFEYITIRFLLVHAIMLIPMFVFVRQKEDYMLYALFTILAGYGGNLLNIIYIRKRVKRKLVRHANIRKHLPPICVLFSSTIAITIYMSSDITMLGIMSTDKNVGIYSAASKIYIIIKELVNAITMVMMPHISNLLCSSDIDKKYDKLCSDVMKVLFALCMPISVGLFSLSKEVILIINGAEYVSGVASLKILSCALPWAVISCFFVNAILIPNRKEKKSLFATVIASFLNISINIFLIPLLGASGAAITTVIAEITVCFIAGYYARKEFEVTFERENFYSVILGCLWIFLICWINGRYIDLLLVRILLDIIISVLGYGFILLILKNPIIKLINNKKMEEMCEKSLFK